MKSKILFLTLVVICFASCIPSLHPIFTENNRTTDDRIIGDWASEASIDVDFDIAVDSDESPEGVTMETLNEELKNSIIENSEDVKYRFERAVTITYEKNDTASVKSSKITLTSQRASQPKEKLLNQGYEITESKKEPFYILTYSEIEKNKLIEDVMMVNLTKIGTGLYMDFMPYKNIGNPSRFENNRIAAHTFAKVEFENGKLKILSFDSDYIEDLIKSRRVRLKHEFVDDRVILTASTEDLRAFILKYGHDEKLFLDSDLLELIN